MHDAPESTPLVFHPAFSFVGLVWGAGNVLVEVARGSPSLLSVLGPILIGFAAVGTLFFNIYKYAVQQRDSHRALQAEVATLKTQLTRLKQDPGSSDLPH